MSSEADVGLQTEEAAEPAQARQDDAPDAMHRLNERFLQASPGAYLRARAYALMSEHPAAPASAGGAAPLYKATRDRVEARLGAATDSIGHLADTALPADRGDTTHALDAFILAYHAYESLLRNLFAFCDSSADSSPWLHLSSRSSHRSAPQFPERLRDLLDLDVAAFDLRVKKFIFGGPGVLSWAAEAGYDSTARINYVGSWVRHAAHSVLDNANAYNAAKHGLASISSYSRISLLVKEPLTHADEGQVLLEEESYLAGPNIDTLEVRKLDGARLWRSVTRVVDPVADIASTLVVAEILDAAWEIGRGAYLGKEEVSVSFLVGPSPRDAARSDHIRVGVLDLPLEATPLPHPASQKVIARLEASRISNPPSPSTVPNDCD